MVDSKHVKLIWITFLKAAGVNDFDRVPNTSDPEHPDVKAILFMYSLDSFLFDRLNQSSRDQDSSVVETLGPFAVALTKIINRVERNRKDKFTDPFVCYRGISLPIIKIRQWEQQKMISLDGYISSTLDEKMAVFFGMKSRERQEGNALVLLKIHVQNEKQMLYISLNREDYSCYVEEKEILL